MSQIEEIVAQLREATETLDTASVTALRAEADARQAQARFDEAGTGSGHRDIRAAIAESRTAAEKAAKVARLIAEATRHIATYANNINPGSMPADQATELATPSGEDLVADSTERALGRAGLGGFLSRMARKADDLQDHASNATTAVQNTINVFRSLDRPSGTTPSTTTPQVAPAQTPARIDAPEAAGNLVVVGLLAGVAIQRSGTIIRRWTARLREREHEDDAD